MTTVQHVAFIGLGAMGFPMAGHIARGGFSTTVHNRSPGPRDDWKTTYAGSLASSPREAAEGADVVCLCVGNDNDVRSVVYGDSGVLAGMGPGALLIDHTTTSAELARELHAACQQQHLHFLDAPVSGGQAGAQSGQLTVMVGGSSEGVEMALPVLHCYAKSIKHMGAAGTGQLTKMVNQICIAGLIQGLAEALNFAQQAGLDGEAVVEVISQGAAQSWQMDNRYKTMLAGEFEFGFAVDWMRKDLGIVMKTASEVGAALPVTSLVDQFYADVQQMGGGRWDTSSLITRLRASAKQPSAPAPGALAQD